MMVYTLLVVAGKSGGGIDMKLVHFEKREEAEIAATNIETRKNPWYTIEVVRLYE